MRILVTGSAGFLGSHLCDRLLAEATTSSPWTTLITGSTDNIAHLSSNRRFQFIHHDVTNTSISRDTWTPFYTFASPASPIDYLELPIQTLKVGSLGTPGALGLALAKETPAAGEHSEVYGDPAGIQTRSRRATGATSAPSAAASTTRPSAFAEAMTMASPRPRCRHRASCASSTPTARACILRITTAVVPNFVSQALRSEPLTVYGGAKQARSFCYVSDLVDGIYRLLMSNESRPVNIGNRPN